MATAPPSVKSGLSSWSPQEVPLLIFKYADNPALLSYANQWNAYLHQQQQAHEATSTSTGFISTDSSDATVFGLAFVDPDYLVACTAAGEVCVWKLQLLPAAETAALSSSEGNDDDDDDDDANAEFSIHHDHQKSKQISSNRSPVLRLKVSESSLYACQWIQRPTNNNNNSWLVVSGDDGVMLLDWETDILPLIAVQQEEVKHKEPVIQYSGKFRAHLKAFPSAFEESIEVNDFVVSGNHLFGAAGDAFGCYKWDIENEKVVRNYKEKGNTGYLHTAELLPDTNLLLFGGEDGILSMWDVSTDHPVERFDLNRTSSEETSKPPSAQRRRRNNSTAGSSSSDESCWISSCKARDENWWTVAGGCSHAGGFVSTFHRPTRSMVSTVSTREAPQQLAFYHEKSSSTLLSVANESFVSHWNNPLSLSSFDKPQRQRVYCNQASAYAVTVSPDAKRIAVGGVGSVVDIFEQKTQYGVQLFIH